MAGLLHIGRYPSGTDVVATQVGEDPAKSRFLAPVTADVMRWMAGQSRRFVSLGFLLPNRTARRWW